MRSYTGYHIPPQHYKVTQPSRKYKVSNLCFKAMSLVRLAHSLLSRTVSFCFSEVCLILGPLRSVFCLIVSCHFLSPFALGSAPLTVLSSCSPPHCWDWWFLNICCKWSKLLRAWVNCCVWFSCFSDPSVICGVDDCIYKFEVAVISADCSLISSSSGCDSGSIYLVYSVEFGFVWHAPFVSFLLLDQHVVFLVLCFCLLCSLPWNENFSVCTLHLSHLWCHPSQISAPLVECDPTWSLRLLLSLLHKGWFPWLYVWLICMQSACPVLHSVSLCSLYVAGKQSVLSCEYYSMFCFHSLSHDLFSAVISYFR